MKKLLLLMLLLISTLSFSIDTYLRIGINGNTRSYENKNKFEDYSPSIGLEISQNFLIFDIGAGIQYNHKASGVGISTTPAYLLARWNIIPIFVKPYLVAKLGGSIYSRENLNNNDVEAGLYYGAGVGMNISFLQAELLYSITELKNDSRGHNNLNQLSLTFGYKL